MRRALLAAAASLLALAASGAAQPWRTAGPGHPWRFPRDHHAHPDYRTEWWYVTGHLAAAAGPERRLGFQFTLFRVGLLREPPALDSAWAATDLVMGHLAVTDLAAGRHAFSETLYRAAAGLGGFGAPDDTVLAWSRAPAGTAGRWELVRRGDGFALRASDARREIALDLALVPTRPLVLHGDGGFSAKDPGGAAGSLYYSATRLATTGGAICAGDTLRVAGASWLDREFFSTGLAREQVGWDWFSLQLDDGRDLMVFRLRDAAGATSATSGTLVERDGTVVPLGADDCRLEPGRAWRSPETGGRYPVRWRLAVPRVGLDLEVEALLDAQENVSRRLPGLAYWEGAVMARRRGSGAEAGRGYLEMTGYGGDRLPM